jgi:mRNA guanylyltransferase
VSLDASHLNKLLSEDYFVSEKADGIRVLLYASVDQANVPYTLLFDRKNDYYRLDGLGLPGHKGGWIKDTLIDGELVNDTLNTPNGPVQVLHFLAFDTLLCDGEKTFQKPYDKRIGRLRAFILDPYMRRVAKDPQYAKMQPFKYVLSSLPSTA